MSLRYKNIIYTIVLFLAMFLVWKYRQGNTDKEKSNTLVVFKGRTMGPIQYTVKYYDSLNRNFKTETDSLLQIFNQSLNTYIPESEISTFNKDSVFAFKLPFFNKVLENAKSIYEFTGGAFDPTVMPLVNAWGFGPEKDIHKDSTYIDSLRQFVGFTNIQYNQMQVWKSDRRVALDFSASAKGYGIDVVFDYLQAKGIENLYVEIGGEVRTSGINPESGNPWTIGILHPDSDELNQFAIAYVSLTNQAMATSGNYFNYHVIDGVKYSHTISPFTGFPIELPILSATVFAEDCMTADALATAFMVVGHEKAMELIESRPDIEGFLIYNNENGIQTYTSPGMETKIKLANK